MEKLAIPKKVADAIDELRKDGDSNCAILTYVLSESNHRAVNLLRGYFDDNFDELMNVLVNGFEIKFSREESVYNYFHDCRASQIGSVDESDWETHKFLEGQIVAIRKTLNLLGLQIKGVTTK